VRSLACEFDRVAAGLSLDANACTTRSRRRSETVVANGLTITSARRLSAAPIGSSAASARSTADSSRVSLTPLLHRCVRRVTDPPARHVTFVVAPGPRYTSLT
jgi:hypothetical protein